MAVVTAVLLALVADQTHRGFDGLPSILVAAFAAGFGLEFVSSSWRDRLQDFRTLFRGRRPPPAFILGLRPRPLVVSAIWWEFAVATH